MIVLMKKETAEPEYFKEFEVINRTAGVKIITTKHLSEAKKLTLGQFRKYITNPTICKNFTGQTLIDL